MLFDRLCGIVERHVPDLIPDMRRAALFKFEGAPEKLIPQRFQQEELKIFCEDFFLPFPVTAIEDEVSCVVLKDTESKQRGIYGVRQFIEINDFKPERIGLAAGDRARTEEELDRAREFCIAMNKKMRDPSLVYMGRFKYVKPEAGDDPLSYRLDGHVSSNMIIDKNGNKGTFLEWDQNAVLRNVVCGVEEIFYFNSPFHFIVEKSDAVAHKASKKGPAIPRSVNRPIYTCLRPKQIREVLRIGESDRPNERAPHWRRRHFRYFESEFYKEMRGQRIIIDAHWVGPTEKVIDGKRYRVRTDL